MKKENLFETERLIIRRFEDKDAQALYENHLDDEVRKWFPNECYADMEAQAMLVGLVPSRISYAVMKQAGVPLRGEKLGEIRDYFGNVLFTEYAPHSGILIHQCSHLNILEGGPMVTYGIPENK